MVKQLEVRVLNCDTLIEPRGDPWSSYWVLRTRTIHCAGDSTHESPQATEVPGIGISPTRLTETIDVTRRAGPLNTW